MAVGNVSSVSPAFPPMMAALGLDEAEVGWVVTAYSLPGVVSAPLGGLLADRLGRRRVLATLLTVFSLAGTACALAPSFGALLALRTVQGTCAAPLVALSITLIGDRYDGPARATAIGYNATALSVGTAAYPVVGGALAGIAWQWPFALPVLALPVGLAVATVLDAPPAREAQTLRQYLRAAWRGVADPRVAGLLATNTGVFVLLFGALLTYVPILAETRFAAAPVVAGGILAAASVSGGVMGTQVGRLTRRFSVRALLVASFALYAAAFAGMALAPSVAALVAATLLFGAAQGVNQPAIQTKLLALAPAASRGVTLSLNGTALRLGQSIGPPVMAAALVVGGVGAVFWLAAALALVLLGAVLAFLR